MRTSEKMKMNRTRIFTVLLLCVMIAASLTACGKTYRIEIESGEDLIGSCPRRAAEGEVVTLNTAVICDGELHLNVSGCTVTMVGEGEYEFVMPANDVTIRASVTSNGLA